MTVVRSSDAFYDLETKTRRRFVRGAMMLLDRILNDLDTTSFTAREVRESFDFLTEIPPAGGELVHFGQKQLQYLVRKKLLNYDEGTRTYSVNYEEID